MAIQRTPKPAIDTTNLADLLERILDKGVVIAGDIRVNLVNVELLTIQLRLVICSVDKAREMGMDWWADNPYFSRQSEAGPRVAASLDRLSERLGKLEASLADAPDGEE